MTTSLPHFTEFRRIKGNARKFTAFCVHVDVKQNIEKFTDARHEPNTPLRVYGRRATYNEQTKNKQAYARVWSSGPELVEGAHGPMKWFGLPCLF